MHDKKCNTSAEIEIKCDKRTGQCPCLNHIEGRTCNHCKFNFYDLANAGATGGCKACACNPSNSLNSDSACDEVIKYDIINYYVRTQ